MITFARLLAIGPALVFSVLPACSSGGGGGSFGDGGSTPSGSSNTPRAGNGATQHPAGATSVACTRAEDCGNWFCDCTGGPPVNGRTCTDGYCLDAAHTCPRSCASFGTEWTGSAGGGPKSTGPSSSSSSDGGTSTSSGDTCTSHTDCDEVMCHCTSGFTVTDYTVQSCDPVKHRCKNAAAACPGACGAFGLQWVE